MEAHQHQILAHLVLKVNTTHGQVKQLVGIVMLERAVRAVQIHALIVTLECIMTWQVACALIVPLVCSRTLKDLRNAWIALLATSLTLKEIGNALVAMLGHTQRWRVKRNARCVQRVDSSRVLE